MSGERGLMYVRGKGIDVCQQILFLVCHVVFDVYLTIVLYGSPLFVFVYSCFIL